MEWQCAMSRHTSNFYHIAVTLLSHYYHITIPLPHITISLPHITITLLSHYLTSPHTTITLLSPCCHTTIILLSLKPFLLKKSISHPNNWLISSEKSHIFSTMSLVSSKMSLVFWKKWHIIKEGSHFIAQLCDRCDSKKHKTPGIYARAYANGEEDVHRLSCANCACTFAVKREEDGENVAFFL